MNHLTGEIHEVNVSSASQAAELMEQYKATMSAIKKALVTISGHLDHFLGNEETFELPNGKLIKRIQRVRTEWTREALGKYLDEDQLDLVSSIRKTDAKKMLAEMIEREMLPPSAIKDVESKARNLPSSPFIQVV